MNFIFLTFMFLAEESADPMKTMDDFQITGQVQRPELNMEITKKNLDREYSLELTESFIPMIIESMKSSPL